MTALAIQSRCSRERETHERLLEVPKSCSSAKGLTEVCQPSQIMVAGCWSSWCKCCQVHSLADSCMTRSDVHDAWLEMFSGELCIQPSVCSLPHNGTGTSVLFCGSTRSHLSAGGSSDLCDLTRREERLACVSLET